MNTRTIVGLLALFAFTLVGCGDPLAEQAQKVTDDNMKKLISCIGNFRLKNDYKGPTDEASLKSFLNGDGSEHCSFIGVSDVDAMFVSERDEQPFRIVYGIDSSPGARLDVPIVFEETGVDGVRNVGFTSLEIRQPKNDAQYKEWFEGNYAPEQTVDPEERKETRPPGQPAGK